MVEVPENGSEDRAPDGPHIAERQSIGRAKNILLTMLVVILAAGLFLGFKGYQQIFGDGPKPEVIVASSLEGLQEQNILVPFTARFVAVVTSKTTRFGLLAKKTLIMPGTVRYQLDLKSLSRKDLDWDGENSTLNITLPPLAIAGPEVDLSDMREYQDGKIIMLLTDAEDKIDRSNNEAGKAELLKQARAKIPMNLARKAARTAIENVFKLPMAAAGIEAKVVARFPSDTLPIQQGSTK